jgi:hypothetical protein
LARPSPQGDKARRIVTLACASVTTRWQAFGLLTLLLVASSRFAAGSLWRGNAGEIERYVLYQAATLGFNYFEFGAVRRGLAGSIAFLLSDNLAQATIAFHFVSALGVALSVVWLFRRLVVSSSARASFALTMLVVMLRWGDDAGRTDMAVACLLGCTAIAFRRGQPALGAACVGLGLFIHESSLIFGLPLLAALVMQGGGWSQLTRRQQLAGGVALALALAAYAGMGALPRADVSTMVGAVRGKLIAHEHVEWAMYYALSGLRGVETSLCQNLTDPSYWVHPTSGLVVMAVAGAALLGRQRTQWAWALLAALPGFVFLCVVANDASRWAMFGCFNIWLVAASAPSAAVNHKDPGRLGLVLAVALIPLVLYRPAKIEYRIYAPSPLLERVVRELGGARTPSVAEALERCDPSWAEVMNGR